MNRRQVLFGAGATAFACGGFVPWGSARAAGAVSTSVTFSPFTQGIRGTYTLNGTVTLTGTVAGFGPMSGGLSQPLIAQDNPVAAPAAPAAPTVAVPVAPAAQATAPVRKPMMSIVPVPRGAARREVSSLD